MVGTDLFFSRDFALHAASHLQKTVASGILPEARVALWFSGSAQRISAIAVDPATSCLRSGEVRLPITRDGSFRCTGDFSFGVLFAEGCGKGLGQLWRAIAGHRAR